MTVETGDGFIFVSIAAADAVVKTDLVADARLKQARKARKLMYFALTGSAAAGDTEVELEVDGESKGTFINTDTGMPDGMVDLIPCDIPMKANQEFSVRVIDAPTTNPLNLITVFK